MKILIIEDNKNIANSIKRGLNQEGFSVDIATNGEDGYDLALTEPYDLLILDWMLPVKSGKEICTDLRKKQVNIPILFLTAKVDIENKIEGLNIGADDYLTKPFDFEELLSRVRALLRRPKQILPEILKCDTLSLNLTSQEVYRSESVVKLTKREFLLLSYMLKNVNTILSKERLLSSVWEYDSEILPNTIEQYMGYLRNKIDKPFPSERQLIRTVKGFGYKLSCE